MYVPVTTPLHNCCAYYQSSCQTTLYWLASSFLKASKEDVWQTKCSQSIDWMYWSVVKVAWSWSNRFCIILFLVADLPPHNTFAAFLFGSECKAITHWRVCLNHTEWLWILNVGLRPSEKQAHGGDSLSSLLIWFFFFLNSFGNKLLTGRSPSYAFGSSAAPSNQTTAGTNILSEWKRSTVMNILFSIGKKITSQ